MIEKAKSCTAAGIITYNPDIDLLHDNVKAVINLVNALWIVDNGSDNIEEIRRLVDVFKQQAGAKFEIIELNSNFGIAFALNCLLEQAKDKKYKWVLTLDQDSRVPDNIIEANAEKLLSEKRIGIISAVIQDRNLPDKELIREDQKYSQIDNCITSASLTNVEGWEKIGGFDEWMFIDEVDHEFCARLVKTGYLILRNNDVVFSHTVGNARPVRFFGKNIASLNHAPLRKYFQIRNILYTSKKIHGKITLKALKDVFIYYSKVIFFEDTKTLKLKKMNEGFVDGLKARPEKFEAPSID